MLRRAHIYVHTTTSTRISPNCRLATQGQAVSAADACTRMYTFALLLWAPVRNSSVNTCRQSDSPVQRTLSGTVDSSHSVDATPPALSLPGQQASLLALTSTSLVRTFHPSSTLQSNYYCRFVLSCFVYEVLRSALSPSSFLLMTIYGAFAPHHPAPAFPSSLTYFFSLLLFSLLLPFPLLFLLS